MEVTEMYCGNVIKVCEYNGSVVNVLWNIIVVCE